MLTAAVASGLAAQAAGTPARPSCDWEEAAAAWSGAAGEGAASEEPGGEAVAAAVQDAGDAARGDAI